MPNRTLLLAAAAVLGLVRPTLAADAPANPKQFQIELLLQRDGRGTSEVLSRPRVRTIEKQEACVLVGQTLTVAGEPVDVGCSFRLLPESTASGKVRLRVDVEVSEVVSNGTKQPEVRVVRRVAVREVKLGGTLKLRVDKQSKKETWLELRVQEVKE
jgi:hypothetical protein